MKVLVTGASGFVGQPLCNELLKSGYSVVATTRSSNKTLHNVDVVNVGEIDEHTHWQHVLKDVDVVIHLAARVHVMNESLADPLAAFRAVNVEGTAQLAKQAANTGVKRFIYTSSIKVNGEHTDLGRPFEETMQPNPHDAYGISKLEAEQRLFQLAKDSEMDVVIIRPPLVYGEGVKANFAKMLGVLKSRAPIPLGNIKNQRSLIYVKNLTNFIITCIQHPNAKNQVFLVSDGDDLSTTELLKKCADALNIKPRLFPIPSWLIRMFARVLGKKNVADRLCSSLQVDFSKAKRLLNWAPPTSVNDGINATVLDWLKGQGQ